MSLSINLDVQGRVAVVTGAGRGIGQAVAKIFALAGAKVIAVDVDEAELNTTIAEMINKDVHLGLAKDLSLVEACEMEDLP